MQRHIRRALTASLLTAAYGRLGWAQPPLSWEQVQERFRANNPNLVASQLAVEESRATEITAGLRPNPEFGVVLDQFRVFSPAIHPFTNAQWTPTVTQLFERRNKRQLRVESARRSTSIAGTDRQDLERTLTFNLRDAFNRVLQAKSILELADQNLRYYDEVIRVNRERLRAGDISQSDLDRIELQRAQFESDLVTAQVNLRTAKIDLLQFMNDRQPADSFEVAGDFKFGEAIVPVPELHEHAIDARPDLKSATTAIDKARVENRLAWANGSTDPIWGLEFQRVGPDNTAGVSLQIPLRLFDRNQGEKARTAVDIERTGKLREALVNAILHDVDAAYSTVESTRRILRPYRDRYLPQAEKVRDSVSFAYRNGGASLLDFLDAQKSYRDAQLAYRNLIGSYLAAVNQLNLALGREVLQ
jgi:cobalt-zinc-cadmium efflux system outer membrane protein